MADIVVIGAGPAGVLAAIRAAELGANVVLVSSGDFGGMAANDGPVPVRTLARAARLIREARQLNEYGVAASDVALDYPRLLARVREVVADVRGRSSLRQRIDSLRVTVHQQVGPARFADAQTVETKNGLRLRADKFIICTGGGSRTSAEAAMIVVAIGWVANTAGLGLAQVGVDLDQRGFVKTDEFLRTTSPNILAAGDITGRLMLVPQALQDGFIAATNAVRGPTLTLEDRVSPTGGFTEPEYASVGLTEAKARASHHVVTATVNFDSTVRTII